MASPLERPSAPENDGNPLASSAGMSEEFVTDHWDSVEINEFFGSLAGLGHLPLSFAPHTSVTLDGSRWTIAHAENGHYLLERAAEDGRTIHRTCNDAELLAENAPHA